MNTLVTTVFWLACFGVTYTYLVYPVLLFIWRSLKRSTGTVVLPGGRQEAELPTVSVVVAAYNEEAVLADKLENLRQINYPARDIEFLVGSDGSTDRTNEILQRAGSAPFTARVFAENRGKAAVLNDLIASARGDVIVLSDANTMYAPSTVARLTSPFDDPKVGGVCGELVLDTDDAKNGAGESWYWRYETAIKRWESDCGTLVGATGGVYAIRRALYEPLDTSRPLTDDLLIALRVVQKGYRVVYEPSAIAHERTAGSVASEFRRKRRIGAQNFSTLAQIAPLLHPRCGFASFALWSHKVIRWIVPFLLVIIVLCSLVLAPVSDLHLAVLVLSGLVGILAGAGWILEQLGVRTGALGLAYYFVAVNTALLFGFFRFVTRSQRTTWTVERQRGGQ